jgi:hypothetical protein
VRDNELYFMRLELPTELSDLIRRGLLSEARELLRELIRGAEGDYRRRLEFELDRLRRWAIQYPYTEMEAYEIASKKIGDLSPEEFRDLISSGCVDHITLDGDLRIYERFLPNMMWLCPSLKDRSLEREDERRIREKEELSRRAREVMESRDYPLIFRFRAEITLRALPRGERLRVWLPVPRVSALHPEVRVISYSREPYISDEMHPQRTAYFELTSGSDDTVWIEYEAVCVPRRPMEEIPDDLRELDGEPEARHREERIPHITFSEDLKHLVSSLTEGLDALERARRIWDWVVENVRYTYVHDYALFDNISEFAFTKRRGDCGVQAILLITMLRLAGIPARWQSGWYANPVDWGMHDWAQFYLEPFGWVYADPSFGHPTEDWRKDFYFGGIEGFRLSFNSEISYPFDPPKESFRSDPVDSQVGEAEWDGGNIYYDMMDSKLHLLEVRRADIRWINHSISTRF